MKMGWLGFEGATKLTGMVTSKSGWAWEQKGQRWVKMRWTTEREEDDDDDEIWVSMFEK